ncbi:MAG: hypothetical protein KGH61_04915 [Candidatus Micrarchaeota archaeon]|nr:hypothetical protein [Candidatus Micrarchaeota archaeon]MDE1848258.1 hypothetical protein [Candidatus Micrarchaeota archaeon]MDE1864388.1 hypothetical protein [Candidatus Micrarchaeota archaeon]
MNDDRNTDELTKNIKKFLDYAEQGQKKFGGPSKYFYSKIIGCHENNSLKELLDDDKFYEYIYATLISWGMHRMGKRGAKMRDFCPFRESIQDCKSELLKLDKKALERLMPDQINQTQNALLTIFHKLKIMKTNSKIVSTSKTLHFILPELVVPIDREYTLRFFGEKNLTSKNEEKIFVELFNRFYKISQKLKLDEVNFKKSKFQPSVAKLIDNAIIGYVAENKRRAD